MKCVTFNFDLNIFLKTKKSVFLNQILDECRFILTTTSGTTKGQLMENEVMKRAVVYDQEVVINNKRPDEP